MMIDEELARAGQYALLANLLFAAPSQALLEALGANDDVLGRAARDADATAVADEFNALFVGVGSGGEVVPYGSWHRTGFLMEEPLAQIRVDLAELGLGRLDGISEPEDHIAGLLETMRLLIESGSPLKGQKEFFVRHIAPWGMQFAAQLGSAPSAHFYRAVVQQLQMFLQVETTAFDMLED
jgi:TorA maturation chaperone TorD